jgi:hypothetical protein
MAFESKKFLSEINFETPFNLTAVTWLYAFLNFTTCALLKVSDCKQMPPHVEPVALL